MKTRLILTLLLPALIAACADAPERQSSQAGDTYVIPAGCVVEADGEVECDEDEAYSSHSALPLPKASKALKSGKLSLSSTPRRAASTLRKHSPPARPASTSRRR